MGLHVGLRAFQDQDEPLSSIGIGTQANLQNSGIIRYGQRLFPITESGEPESAALYFRVDPQAPNALAHGITAEITSNQGGADASAFKAIHAGFGDAYYAAIIGNGAGFEGAGFFSGARSFIGTNQQISGGPGDFGASVHYDSLWGTDGSVFGSTTRPNAGAFLANRAQGHSLRINLNDTALFAFAKFPEIRMNEWNFGRDRFIIYNEGSVEMSSTIATVVDQFPFGPELEVKRNWWNAGSPVDRSWTQNLLLDGSGDPSWQLAVGPTGSEVVGLTVNQSGDVAVGNGFATFGATPPASQPGAIVDASGGSTIDAEARTAVNALLAVVRDVGLFAT